MVHVPDLDAVLRKVWRALRSDGLLLIIQPAPANTITQLEVEGKIEFVDELEEPNFSAYLEANRVSICNALADHLFTTEAEITTLEESLYNSVDEWIEDHRPFCKDLDAFDAMSVQIQSLVRRREHRILEYWEEYRILLRKTQPGQSQRSNEVG